MGKTPASFSKVCVQMYLVSNTRQPGSGASEGMSGFMNMVVAPPELTPNAKPRSTVRIISNRRA
jgi:hypothetical protein